MTILCESGYSNVLPESGIRSKFSKYSIKYSVVSNYSNFLITRKLEMAIAIARRENWVILQKCTKKTNEKIEENKRAENSMIMDQLTAYMDSKVSDIKKYEEIKLNSNY